MIITERLIRNVVKKVLSEQYKRNTEVDLSDWDVSSAKEQIIEKVQDNPQDFVKEFHHEERDDGMWYEYGSQSGFHKDVSTTVWTEGYTKLSWTGDFDVKDVEVDLKDDVGNKITVSFVQDGYHDRSDMKNDRVFNPVTSESTATFGYYGDAEDKYTMEYDPY